jgi:putative aldouronate transport system permease protein
MSNAYAFEHALRRNRLVDRVFYTFTYSGFILFSLSIIYPFFYILVNSLNGELLFGPVLLWPKTFTLSNYTRVFSDNTIVRSLGVSFSRILIGSVIAVFVDSMCAFALRKARLSFRSLYLILFTIPMFFQGGLIPRYLNLKMLGLLDNYFVYILPPVFRFFYVIILMSAFREIPDSMEESAHMDGAGYFTIYRRIYLPMSIPVLATIFLFVGVWHWETWFDTLYFTQRESLQTFSAFLMKVVRKFSSLDSETEHIDEDTLVQLANQQGIRFAAIIVAILPVLMIYPFIQKYFVTGLRLGAIKE